MLRARYVRQAQGLADVIGQLCIRRQVDAVGIRNQIPLAGIAPHRLRDVEQGIAGVQDVLARGRRDIVFDLATGDDTVAKDVELLLAAPSNHFMIRCD